jgi:ubiquinone/menaquinone biosynthesis C-methylase UbiE
VAESSQDANLKKVWRYYDLGESRIGYRVLLGGTKHFGYYEPGQSMWHFKTAMRRMEDLLAERLAQAPGGRVLDAGCGVGNVARALATRHGLDVTGIDILEFNLQEAARRTAAAGLGERTRFQLGDYHHLDFPDCSFDGVYTMETLVHSANPKAALAEFHRVLRPSGRLVMFEYSRTLEDEVSAESNEALRRVCDGAAMPALLQLYHGTLDELLASQGFAVEDSRDVTANMMPMLRAFSLIGKLPYWCGRVSGLTSNVVNAMSACEMYKHSDVWRYGVRTAIKQ